jgi:hypothetical protein
MSNIKVRMMKQRTENNSSDLHPHYASSLATFPLADALGALLRLSAQPTLTWAIELPWL